MRTFCVILLFVEILSILLTSLFDLAIFVISNLTHVVNLSVFVGHGYEKFAPSAGSSRSNVYRLAAANCRSTRRCPTSLLIGRLAALHPDTATALTPMVLLTIRADAAKATPKKNKSNV